MSTIQPKTAVLQDKRLWVSILTVIALLLSTFFGVELNTELLATIATIIVSFVTNSAIKEARVASAMTAATPTPAPAATPAPTTDTAAANTIANQ